MKDNVYIERITKYSEKIVKYMSEIDAFKDFEVNDEKIDAVILNLEQIGETAKKLSSEIKATYRHINWPSIIGLRNMISHEYEGIKLNIIYDIAIKNYPWIFKTIKT